MGQEVLVVLSVLLSWPQQRWVWWWSITPAAVLPANMPTVHAERQPSSGSAVAVDACHRMYSGSMGLRAVNLFNKPSASSCGSHISPCLLCSPPASPPADLLLHLRLHPHPADVRLLHHVALRPVAYPQHRRHPLPAGVRRCLVSRPHGAGQAGTAGQAGQAGGGRGAFGQEQHQRAQRNRDRGDGSGARRRADGVCQPSAVIGSGRTAVVATVLVTTPILGLAAVW